MSFIRNLMTAALSFINFKDSAVKALCVAAWGKGGKLSYKQAASVKTNWSWTNTDIKTFDELKYFTGLTSSPSFSGCTSLYQVTLPEQITSICYNAFNSTAIEEIKIPENVNTIGNNAFLLCSKLKIVNIPYNVTVISSSAFDNCTSLETINLHEGITTLGFSAFKNCNKLKITSLPDSLEVISYGALEDCLFPAVFTKFPNNLRILGYNNFKGATFNKGGNLIKDKFVSTPSGLTELTGTGSGGQFLRWKGYVNFAYLTKISADNARGGFDGLILPSTIIDVNGSTDYGRYSLHKRLVWQDGGITPLSLECMMYALLCYTNNTPHIIRDFPANLNFTGSSNALSWNVASNYVKYTIFRSSTAPTLSNTTSTSWKGKIFIYENNEEAYSEFFNKACKNVNEVKCFIGSQDWADAMKALATEEGYGNDTDGWLDVFANENYNWYDEFVDYDIYGVTRPSKNTYGYYNTNRLSTEITFEDDLVQSLCITNIDVNEDNVITMDEILTPISENKTIPEPSDRWGPRFFTGTDIVTFNEFKYFEISRIRSIFYNCPKLESIELSYKTTIIDTYNDGAFENCPSLKRIVFNSSISTWTNYANQAFMGTPNIEKVVIPSVEVYLKNTYQTGTQGTTTVNKDVPTWGGKASLYIKGDEENALGTDTNPLIIPKSITVLNKYALNNLSSVTNLQYEGTSTEWEGVTLNDYCFYGLGTSTIHCNGDNVDVTITTTD